MANRTAGAHLGLETLAVLFQALALGTRATLSLAEPVLHLRARSEHRFALGLRVGAALAPAGLAAELLCGKALAVELEAAGVPAVARLPLLAARRIRRARPARGPSRAARSGGGGGGWGLGYQPSGRREHVVRVWGGCLPPLSPAYTAPHAPVAPWPTPPVAECVRGAPTPPFGCRGATRRYIWGHGDTRNVTKGSYQILHAPLDHMTTHVSTHPAARRILIAHISHTTPCSSAP